MDKTTIEIAQLIQTMAEAGGDEISNQKITMDGTDAASMKVVEAFITTFGTDEQTVQDSTTIPWTDAEKASAVIILDKIDPSFMKKMREEKSKQAIWIPRAKEAFVEMMDRYVEERMPSVEVDVQSVDLGNAEAIKALMKEQIKEVVDEVKVYYEEFEKGLDGAVKERFDRIQPTPSLEC